MKVLLNGTDDAKCFFLCYLFNLHIPVMRWVPGSSPSYGPAGEKTVAWAGEELALDSGSPDGNAGPCRHEMFI